MAQTVVAMTERSLTSHSPDETHAWGVALGEVLQSGDFVGLSGDLGAGKTHFVRGVAQGAGVASHDVSSPTFAIVHSYRGRITLHHADLYRLRDADELYATGFHELIDSGAMLVEWIDQVPEAAPSEALWIRITPLEEDSRRFELRAIGERHESLLRDWLARTQGR